MRTVLVLTVAVAICAGSRGARAQDAAGKATAEQLFQEGRALMQQGRCDAAIAKFQASLDLDPGSGTQGNLAVCYERVGKLASAWRHYREAADRAEREGNADRARAARELAAALEPRLPRLIIQLASSHDLAGLVITRDGAAVPRSALGTAVYVDPGEHEIAARAPGRERFSLRFTLSEAQERVVEIPALAPARTPQVSADARPEPEPAPARPMVPEPADQPQGDPGRARRIAGWAVGGAGLVTLATSLGVGASAITTWDRAFDSGACDADTRECTPAGQAQTDTARSRARLSNVLAVTGVTAVAAGAVLYFTARRPREKRAARIVPFAAEDTMGVAVVGGF